jgi:hypothetical protein
MTHFPIPSFVIVGVSTYESEVDIVAEESLHLAAHPSCPSC